MEGASHKGRTALLQLKALYFPQHLFGQKGKQKARFELFSSAPFRGKNLLFRDATQHLQLLEDQAEIAHILGLDYVALLKGLGHEGEHSQGTEREGEKVAPTSQGREVHKEVG